MVQVTEREARRVAEENRETEWRHPSFLRELFLGRCRPALLPAYPRDEASPEFAETYEAFKSFLCKEVDPVEIDERGEYPPAVLESLARLRAFGLLVPKAYGGHGLNKVEWCRLIELCGSYDNNLVGLLSPHQSVGVPECVKQFGTEEQKKTYLTACANGVISAFALTEPDVGSDPARLNTTAERTEDGFILNGLKLWCTNGTMAGLLIVMARHTDTGKISAFVVEMDREGIEIIHRCRFMGLRALANGLIRFTDVHIPKESLLGVEGKGLRLALTVLNHGRLSVPAAVLGTAKKCLEIGRQWSAHRVQWGRPIGQHEINAHKLARIAATTFAMESILYTVAEMTVIGKYDIRLEAGAVKEWITARGWEIVDETLQLRGGRGYETERSLAARGETPAPLERMLRDTRITRIFEGASEIMHLFLAREAVDKFLETLGEIIAPESGRYARLRALPRAIAFYAWWYPTRWLGWGHWPRFLSHGALATHRRFADRSARRLARQIFSAMAVYGERLEYKQAFLFRTVDIAMELFAMVCSIQRVQVLRKVGAPNAKKAEELADIFCRGARRKIEKLFKDLWRNDDDLQDKVAASILHGEHAWLEEGIIRDGESLVPASLRDIRMESVPKPGAYEARGGTASSGRT